MINVKKPKLNTQPASLHTKGILTRSDKHVYLIAAILDVGYWKI